MSNCVNISIIMPAFNAADTISISLNSLLNQDQSDVQLIIINDCSSDNTEEVINSYASKFLDKGWTFDYIKNAINGGVANARNIGLENAVGEYIYYVDADDYLEEGALTIMINEAKENDLDILGFNWFLTFSKNSREMRQPHYSESKDAIEYMLKGLMRWNLWIFFVKRSLYEDHQIRFLPHQNMGEDLLVTIKLFAVAKKVKSIDKSLYFYAQSNEQSLTKIYSQKHIDEVTANVNALEQFLKNRTLFENIHELMMFMKLNIKLPMLISDNIDNYKKWENWFPESNNYISRNKQQAFRTRLLQRMALKKQYWYVKFYYLVIYRFVYGVIYN